LNLLNEGIEILGPLLQIAAQPGRSTNNNRRISRQQNEVRMIGKESLTEEQAVMRLTSEDAAVCHSMGISARKFIAARDGDDTSLDADCDPTDKTEPYTGCSYCAAKHETDRHAGDFAECSKCRASHGDESRHADPESDSTELDARKKKLTPEQAVVNKALGISDKEFGAHNRS
jgi:hypothetical protein